LANSGTSGLEHVVDMDLSKYFDLLDHDLVYPVDPVKKR
jgi:hypothetical protein